MSDPVYEEMSSLRRMCAQQRQKLEMLEKKHAEIEEMAGEMADHLESAEPCLWLQTNDMSDAAEWCGKRDYLVGYFRAASEKS